MGPFAGNLRVRRNVISLDQLQLEHQGGNITGQLIAELKKGASSVLFRGNVTGLRPSGSDEVLDANAALMFSPEKLELEGRVQIVRMGRGHLRDALDLLDPYSADPNMNTIRTALSLGYPEYVRLRFHHGFLSAKVELGGLADVVRIDEIRGIATGPLLHRYVGPLLRPE
jgi:translocation and assembly module TamB